MSIEEEITLRPAEPDDLDKVNAVIESCVMGWDLPERVKRLSLSSYQYFPHDLQHLDLLLAIIPGEELAGVAAWELAAASELPENREGMLLHGLYVALDNQRRGVGSLLLNAVLEEVRSRNLGGLLVKAQPDAVGFFKTQGFVHLPVGNTDRDYPYRWWKET